MSVRGAAGELRRESIEGAIELIARHLVSIAPAVRASVCVEALKRARQRKAPTKEKGSSE